MKDDFGRYLILAALVMLWYGWPLLVPPRKLGPPGKEIFITSDGRIDDHKWREEERKEREFKKLSEDMKEIDELEEQEREERTRRSLRREEEKIRQRHKAPKWISGRP